jgi:hypothetical protein
MSDSKNSLEMERMDTTIVTDVSSIDTVSIENKKTNDGNMEENIEKSVSITEISKSNCVVILGAFANNKNLEKLKEVLLKDIDDKRLYLVLRNGYNAIGIYVDCKSGMTELQNYRRKYNKRAWLLNIKSNSR